MAFGDIMLAERLNARDGLGHLLQTSIESDRRTGSDAVEDESTTRHHPTHRVDPRNPHRLPDRGALQSAGHEVGSRHGGAGGVAIQQQLRLRIGCGRLAESAALVGHAGQSEHAQALGLAPAVAAADQVDDGGGFQFGKPMQQQVFGADDPRQLGVLARHL